MYVNASTCNLISSDINLPSASAQTVLDEFDEIDERLFSQNSDKNTGEENNSFYL